MLRGPQLSMNENELAIMHKVVSLVADDNVLLRFKTRETPDGKRILRVKRAGYLDMCSVAVNQGTARARFLRHKVISPKNIRGWFNETEAYNVICSGSVWKEEDVEMVSKDIAKHLTYKFCMARDTSRRIDVVGTKEELTSDNVYGGFIKGLVTTTTEDKETIEVKLASGSIFIPKASILMTLNNLRIGNFFCININNDACAMNTFQAENYFKI